MHLPALRTPSKVQDQLLLQIQALAPGDSDPLSPDRFQRMRVRDPENGTGQVRRRLPASLPYDRCRVLVRV